MLQEDNELLLKDLSARLFYGIIIYRITDNSTHKFIDSDIEENIDMFSHFLEYSGIENIKPYLRPMSSMTEEEKRHISKIMCLRTYDNGVVYDMTYSVYTPYYVMEDCLTYLRSIHVDYSGLIEKGLALEAKEGMYNLKKK